LEEFLIFAPNAWQLKGRILVAAEEEPPSLRGYQHQHRANRNASWQQHLNVISVH
jgi:hypothetical protein